MLRNAKKLGLAVIGIALVVGFSGCPLLFPFAATGTYTGAWTADVPIIGSVDCPLSMDLTTVGPLVGGMVTFDFACFLPPDVIDAIGGVLGTTELTVPVLGTLQSNGDLTLTFDPSALTDSLGFTVEITFAGTGADADDDGTMDTYEGDFSLRWTIQTDVPGYEEVEVVVDGTFETTLTV